VSPDFVKLADAHGLPGMRVTTREAIPAAVAAARATNKTFLVEFRVEAEDAVYPMVPSGAELHDMIRRPLSVAVLPALPLSAAIARDASRAGMEVLLGLPMEPYRFPELDPGPGALLMSMAPGEIQQLVGSHLETMAPAVGVVNRMGSRLTEDRPRMRAVLEVLAARRLFLVDAYTSSQSVAFDEARDKGVRAARRHILVDHARGEAGDRARWDEVAGWAERRGEVIVVAHGHPLTVRLLKEYVPRWEARGLRLVPVSQLAR
jgi:polysaccharide deacetylase 2 family uncharacterized protein YibQ